MKFKIVSFQGLAGASFGQIVDLDDLNGCNIQALVDGGHIVAVETKMKSDGKSKNLED